MARDLAQLNLATLLAPLDDPTLAGFVDNLDRINRLAERAPGFRWRFETPAGDATAADHPFGDDVIVNISTWDSVASLHDYVYRTAHAEIMSKRRDWFARMAAASTVLWWVPAGHRPTPWEADVRLQLLRERGATADAFTFKQPWPAPTFAGTPSAPAK